MREIQTKATCILGMHRSGTSMLAKTLFELGLDFGPYDHIMPANSSNPLGYFENHWIVYKINDELLKHLKGSWCDPPLFPQDWEEDPFIQKLINQAKRYIQEHFLSSHWGWKDPRNSILLPFWKHVIPELRYVICLRNPLDVAKSLKRREGFSITKGIVICERYVSTVLEQTKDASRLIVYYEDFIQKPIAEIHRLADFCGFSVPSCMYGENAGVFPQLRHHDSFSNNIVFDSDVRVANSVSDYMSLKASQKKLCDPIYRERHVSKYVENSFQLIVPHTDNPLVSIVIPTYNKVNILKDCLTSVVCFTNVPYELIIVDDCSSDATEAFLRSVDNVTIIRNEENLDFLRSANAGAANAKGKYIMFLNNDVFVRPNWLSILINTIETYPNCGAVGPKFINMDGTLQEAGSIILSDANVIQYGRGDGVFQPEYNYVREVDYCSAACLLISTDLFIELGGFNERYTPAYYEDPDLCFKIMEKGNCVVYQPLVAVFHHGVASRPLSKAQELCEINRLKFFENWQHILSSRDERETALSARDRRTVGRILVVYKTIPDLGSGCSAVQNLLNLLVSRNFIVTILPVEEPYARRNAIIALQQRGVEVLYGPYLDPGKMIQQRIDFYKTIVIGKKHYKKFLSNIITDMSKVDVITVDDAVKEICA